MAGIVLGKPNHPDDCECTFCVDLRAHKDKPVVDEYFNYEPREIDGVIIWGPRCLSR